MDNRETKTIKTPVDDHEVIFYAFVTGRERRELRDIYLDMMQVKSSMKGGRFVPELQGSQVSPKLIKRAEDKMIEMLVISVNNVKENLVDKVLDMKSQDYDFVMEELNRLTQEEGLKKK